MHRDHKFRITNLHERRPNSDLLHEPINKFHYVIYVIYSVYLFVFRSRFSFSPRDLHSECICRVRTTKVDNLCDDMCDAFALLSRINATCEQLRVWLRLFQMRNTPSRFIAEITLSNCAFRVIKVDVSRCARF